MWIAGRLGRTEDAQESAAVESGTVTIGGSTAGVLTRGEERSLPVAAPGGYVWRPKNGERVLVLRGGTLGEERYIAASLGEAAAKQYAAAALAEESALTVESVELTERGDDVTALRVLLSADGESASVELTVGGA